jgi:hypothetical protein
MDTFGNDFWRPHCRVEYAKNGVAPKGTMAQLSYPMPPPPPPENEIPPPPPPPPPSKGPNTNHLKWGFVLSLIGAIIYFISGIIENNGIVLLGILVAILAYLGYSGKGPDLPILNERMRNAPLWARHVTLYGNLVMILGLLAIAFGIIGILPFILVTFGGILMSMDGDRALVPSKPRGER